MVHLVHTMAHSIILRAVVASTLLSVLASAQTDCPFKLADGPKTTVIFVADPGTFSATPEALVYLQNLRNAVKLPSGLTACASASVGTIMRQNVAVITTGIGPSSAAMCVYDVVMRCGPRIKDVIYSGTSGWSPQLGGVINNGTCEKGRANTNGKITRIGDVCVSPYSVNWDCRKASWSETCEASPNQCNFPEQNNGPADDFLFGQCQFSQVKPEVLKLADEVLAAAAKRGKALLPRRNKKIQSDENTFWSRMKAGTGLAYPRLEQSAAPTVWNYKQCMEIDSQFFYSGAPWDMVARKYVAGTLNAAFKTKTFAQTGVIAVSAMEAIGLSMAMERYHGLSSTKRLIPYTNVRGMSNWLHQPQVHKGKGLWVEGEHVPEDFVNGYKYAISTASTIVLSMLQTRCEAAVTPLNLPTAERGAACVFKVSYA